jgi:lysylphosphatidylglycerol synthetase-like protein (DUF2156 family)
MIDDRNLNPSPCGLQLQSELLFQSFRERRHSRVKLSVCTGGRRIVALRHLWTVAYRMLGSLSKADDVVQEVWLRLSQSDHSSVENLGGWLTTVVARVCLDMLRSRKSRREESLETPISQIETHLAD